MDKDKKKKITKIIVAASSAFPLLLVGSLLLTFLYIQPNTRQKNIIYAINNKDYETAEAFIEQNGSFGNNSKYKEMVKAGKYLDEGRYEIGISLLYSAYIDVNVNYDPNGGATSKTSETIKKSKYIENTPSKDNCVFTGWTLNDYYMRADKFEVELDLKANWYDYTPKVSSDGKTVTYGLYPQNHITDPTAIDRLTKLPSPEPNGWYLYNGEYYVKAKSDPYQAWKEFDNGEEIKFNTIYWFKCEPIEWTVLSKDGSDYFLYSKQPLDVHLYHDPYKEPGEVLYYNDYEHSDIRAWLNNEFYNTAFQFDDSKILTTEVDNSTESMCDDASPYACNNTFDKIFLLSRKELSTEAYGFNPDLSYQDPARQCRPSEYARAMGSICSTNYDSYFLNCDYWTRSPKHVVMENDELHAVYIINNHGSSIYELFTGYRQGSVRPAMHITIE